jgi:hypothetical protein
MNSNLYQNRHLGFSIEKPALWDFLPVECAVNDARNEPRTPEQVLTLIEPRKPFVYFHLLHEDEHELYPTVQANCRLKDVSLTQAQFLEAMIAGLSKSLLEFQLMESSSEQTMAEIPATYLRCDYLAQGLDGIVCHSIMRAYSLFTSRFTFVLTMIGAFSGIYQRELDFQGILKSIQVTNI